jgi:hypothetical protein
VVVHGEEMVVQLVKQVKMPPWVAVPVNVVVLVGGDGRGVSCSIDFGENLISEGGPIPHI